MDAIEDSIIKEREDRIKETDHEVSLVKEDLDSA